MQEMGPLTGIERSDRGKIQRLLDLHESRQAYAAGVRDGAATSTNITNHPGRREFPAISSSSSAAVISNHNPSQSPQAQWDDRPCDNEGIYLGNYNDLFIIIYYPVQIFFQITKIQNSMNVHY